jgi:hypothetical protein
MRLGRIVDAIESAEGPLLLVLDDVWDRAVMSSFDLNCRVLLTCRDAGILRDLGKRANYESVSKACDFAVLKLMSIRNENHIILHMGHLTVHAGLFFFHR